MTDGPPHTITLRWCPACGRNDRYRPFTGKSHFHLGAPCKGQPQPITYDVRMVDEGDGREPDGYRIEGGRVIPTDR